MCCHFGRLWYAGPNAISNSIGYEQHYSRSEEAVIRVYDAARDLSKRTNAAASSSRQSGAWVTRWLLLVSKAFGRLLLCRV